MWALFSLLALSTLFWVFLLLLVLMPVYLRLTYDGSVHLRIRVLFFPVYLYGGVGEEGNLQIYLRVMGKTIPLYPPEKKDETEKVPASQEPTKEGKPVEPQRADAEQEKPSKMEELLEEFRKDDLSGILEFLKELAETSGRTVNRILSATTVTRMEWQMRIATGDPFETAQLYGQVCSVFYPALALVGQKVRIRRHRLRVEPNFLLDQSDVRFDIRARMATPRLIFAGVAFLLKFFVLVNKDDADNNPKMTKEVS